jgi:hypothetical protein
VTPSLWLGNKSGLLFLLTMKSHTGRLLALIKGLALDTALGTMLGCKAGGRDGFVTIAADTIAVWPCSVLVGFDNAPSPIGIGLLGAVYMVCHMTSPGAHPIRLFHLPFWPWAVLESLTYCVYAAVSARCPRPNWLRQSRLLEQAHTVF